MYVVYSTVHALVAQRSGARVGPGTSGCSHRVSWSDHRPSANEDKVELETGLLSTCPWYGSS